MKILRTLPGAIGLVTQVLVAVTLSIEVYQFVKSKMSTEEEP